MVPSGDGSGLGGRREGSASGATMKSKPHASADCKNGIYLLLIILYRNNVVVSVRVWLNGLKGALRVRSRP